MDAFEKHIKGSLDQYEVPYNSADWAHLEKALSGQDRTSRWGSVGILALLLGVGMVTATILYLGSDTTADIERALAATEQQANTERSTVPASEADKPISTGQGITRGPATPVEPVSTTAVDQKTANIERTPVNAGSTPPKKNGIATVPPVDKGKRSTEAKASSEPGIQASASEGCPGTSIRFNVENMPEGGIYLWNFGDGSFSNKPTPDHVFTKPGRFEVMLSVSSSNRGNIKNKPSSDEIVIHEAPEAQFTAMKQEYAGHIPSVHFENRALGGDSYLWEFGDGNTSSVAHPDHVYRKQGVYNVKLTVMSQKGCIDRHEREVRIEKDYNLDAPSSFSPNSDGNEDTFMPQALRDLGVKFDLVIHEEKTGRRVYETSDANRPWTGRLMNGSQVCPPGEYVWMVEIREGAHIGNVVYDGKVSLVR